MPHDHRGRPLGNNHRPLPRLSKAIGSYLGVPSEAGQDIIDAYRGGSKGDVYGGNYWNYSPDELNTQDAVNKAGGTSETISGAIHHKKMNDKYNTEDWRINPESFWDQSGNY